MMSRSSNSAFAATYRPSLIGAFDVLVTVTLSLTCDPDFTVDFAGASFTEKGAAGTVASVLSRGGNSLPKEFVIDILRAANKTQMSRVDLTMFLIRPHTTEFVFVTIGDANATDGFLVMARCNANPTLAYSRSIG